MLIQTGGIADMMSMDLRENPRLGAVLLLVRVSGVNLDFDSHASMLDVCASGLSVLVAHPIPCASFVRVEFEDCVIFGEVRYCEPEQDGYRVGLFVEQVALGKSDLSRLMDRLLEDAFEAGVVRQGAD